ncbi:hypothetical protein AGMMS49938_17760 [Fibrobacterales bacterium]|nr:hypothetical protein AGMMS49938_17760 [Fibrobacterales bacterium]
MKKILVLLLALFASIAFAQDRQKVAVYMAGTEPKKGVYKVLGGQITKAITKSGDYSAVDRTDAILQQLKKEHGYQRSGAVSDDQIKKLGSQLGVKYLCIAEITEVMGDSYLEAKLIDVETALVENTGNVLVNMSSSKVLLEAADEVAVQLVGSSSGGGNTQRVSSPAKVAASGKKNGYSYNPDGIELVFVEGGSFRMGDWYNEGQDDERPAHSVTVGSFSISKYEVTQGLWKEYMGGSNPSNFKGDYLPVEKVSWNDVQTFISNLNARTGKNYRLPTEAEWEYAARGGSVSKGYRYSGSNNIGDVAWYVDNSGRQTHRVGTKASNELGIYDMSGNVWEWCSDWYAGDYYMRSPSENPTGAGSGSNRVLRGGSWYSDATGARVAYRGNSGPGNSGNALGFRLVLP